MKHKHADVIHAWADGAEIQDREPGGNWFDSGPSPLWLEHKEYRIKPKTIKYRNFLWVSSFGKIVVSCCTWEENGQESRENWKGFVKWISNWIEVEVE